MVPGRACAYRRGPELASGWGKRGDMVVGGSFERARRKVVAGGRWRWHSERWSLEVSGLQDAGNDTLIDEISWLVIRLFAFRWARDGGVQGSTEEEKQTQRALDLKGWDVMTSNGGRRDDLPAWEEGASGGCKDGRRPRLSAMRQSDMAYRPVAYLLHTSMPAWSLQFQMAALSVSASRADTHISTAESIVDIPAMPFQRHAGGRGPAANSQGNLWVRMG